MRIYAKTFAKVQIILHISKPFEQKDYILMLFYP